VKLRQAQIAASDNLPPVPTLSVNESVAESSCRGRTRIEQAQQVANLDAKITETVTNIARSVCPLL
jgi:hypothetical protein